MGIVAEAMVEKESDDIKTIQYSMQVAENDLAHIENELESLSETDMNYGALKERKEKALQFITRCKIAINAHAFRRCLYSVGLIIKNGQLLELKDKE